MGALSTLCGACVGVGLAAKAGAFPNAAATRELAAAVASKLVGAIPPPLAAAGAVFRPLSAPGRDLFSLLTQGSRFEFATLG